MIIGSRVDTVAMWAEFRERTAPAPLTKRFETIPSPGSDRSCPMARQRSSRSTQRCRRQRFTSPSPLWTQNA